MTLQTRPFVPETPRQQGESCLRGWVLAAFAVSALLAAGCQPTIGNDGAFVPAPTTNTDFFAPTRIPVGLQPYSVAVAPSRASCAAGGGTAFAPNVAVANYADNTISYLTNSGNGTLTVTNVIPVTFAPAKILFADLDGTSVANCTDDLVVMNTANIDGLADGITVITTSDNMNFAQQFIPLGGTPYQVSAIDMDPINANGVDIVVSVPDLFELAVLRNNGLGGFSAAPTITSFVGIAAPTHFAVSDFTPTALDLKDGDTCLDMAVLFPALSQIYTLSSANGGSCGAYPTAGFATAGILGVSANAYSVLAADLTGTGFLDFVADTTTEAVLSVYINNGATPAGFSLFNGGLINDSGGSTRMLVDDFGAAHPSVVVVRPSAGTLSSFTYNGSSFTAPGYTLTGTPFDMAAGDFTGDGKKDLAVSENKLRVVYIGRGDGTGGFVFSQIGFRSAPSTPVVERLRSGTAKDLIVPLPLDNSVMVFLSKSP